MVVLEFTSPKIQPKFQNSKLQSLEENVDMQMNANSQEGGDARSRVARTEGTHLPSRQTSMDLAGRRGWRSEEWIWSNQV